MNAWIVFLIIAVPLLLLLALIANSDSLITVPPGKVGLLLISGRATDKVVEPGLHWVPRLRRRMVADYPSLELAYRAAPDYDGIAEGGELDRTGPATSVTLGDRTNARVGYTVRFRLDISRLRIVHEQFGAEGVFTAVRDISGRAVRARLAESDTAVDSLFGSEYSAIEAQLAAAVTEALDPHGIKVTMFAINDVDLGRTGEVIQSTLRARLELEREEAETSLREARARNDAALAPMIDSVSDVALRYREVEVLRDLAYSQPDRVVPVSARRRGRSELSDSATAGDAAEVTEES